MKAIIKRTLLVSPLVIFAIISMITGAFAVSEPFEIFGKDLLVKGSIQQNLDLRTHRDERDVQWSSNKSTFRIEGTYDLATSNTWNMKIYGLFTYWYDTGTEIDTHLEDAIHFEDGSYSGIKENKRSNEEEEILKEIYLEYRTNQFQIRLGKQIVSWGETAEAQVADVINPLDITNLKVFPDWEDLKVGLWMARLFYIPENMWQDLSFELIFIPHNFQHIRMPSAGAGLYFGTPQMPEGVFGKILHHMEHDKPGDDWNNSEWGVRLRGYSFNTDWTLSYFYSRLDTGLVNRDKGFRQMLNLMFGLPMKDKIFRFPHYHSTAFTTSMDVPKIRSTIRCEAVLNHRDYQYGASDIRSKKVVTTAIAIDRSTFIPWLTPWNRQRFLGVNVTWYHYKLLGHKYNKHTGEFIAWESGTRDSSWDKISLMLDYSFHHNDFQQFFNFVYDFNGQTNWLAVLIYAPGDHWRYSVSYQQINEKGQAGRLQDQVMFSIRYEF